jgi:hypothetical protein
MQVDADAERCARFVQRAVRHEAFWAVVPAQIQRRHGNPGDVAGSRGTVDIDGPIAARAKHAHARIRVELGGWQLRPNSAQIEITTRHVEICAGIAAEPQLAAAVDRAVADRELGLSLHRAQRAVGFDVRADVAL